jgi:hypothetical protein
LRTVTIIIALKEVPNNGQALLKTCIEASN